MLNAKFPDIGFWFWRRFFKVFAIYGHGGHLGHVTWTIYTNFRSPFPRRLHIKFGFDWPSSFRGEDVCKCERTTTTDGRTPDQLVSYKLTGEGSGELKSLQILLFLGKMRKC